MYSQCPECLTRFRVTAAALRAAHGTVRCGRCGSAFDALPRLTDTLPEGRRDEPLAPLPPVALGLTAAAMIEPEDASSRDEGALITEFHFSPDDIDQVFVEARDWDRRFNDPDEALRHDETPANSDDTRSVRALREANLEPADDDAVPLPTSIATGAPEMWVHEPERIEDITLEGERIVIEGLPEETEAGEEVAGDTEAGSDAEVHQILTGDHEDAVRLPTGAEPVHDLDSTDRFEILRLTRSTAAPAAPDEEGNGAPASLPEDEFASQVEEALRLQAIAETARSAAVYADTEVTPPETLSAAPAPMPPAAAVASDASVASESAVRRATAPATLGAARFQRSEWPLLEEDEAATTEDTRRGWVSTAWGVGALLLALALVAQVVHHYRQALARDAFIGPAVQSVYHWLGLPLAANWDLNAFELRQWGSGSGPSADGHLDVRASLRNDAPFAQPLPLLRVDLEDRYGGTVARRDFAPPEYLKDPAQASRLLAPGTSTEAELAIAGATSDAVGYRLDVCLHDGAGTVTCSQAPGDASSGR